MHDPHDPQVLCVGAGPVGLTLAAELLRHGTSCRLVDQAAAPSPWSRAAVLHSRTLDILADMGVADEALAQGRKVRGLQIFSRGRRLARFSLEETGRDDTRFPFVLGLSQRETESLLAALVERRGGRIERGVELLGFTQDPMGVTARLLHTGPPPREETVRARWLAGCDGALSAVRSGLGLGFPGESYEEVALQADLRIAWPAPVPTDEILAFFSPAGVIAAMPLLAGGRYRLLVISPQAGDIEPTLANFQALMDQRGPRGAVLSDPAWTVAFPLRRGLAPCFQSGRVFLAGDAAHQQNPVSGQGMNLGIQDAHNLAWKLALFARGRGRAALPESYTEERRPVAAETLELADELARVFARFMMLESPEAQAVQEEALERLAHDARFLHRLSQGAGMVGVHYRGSPIVDEHGAADFAGGPSAGEHAPDVALAAGGWLHERLGGSCHVLLLFTGPAGEGAAELAELAGAVQARYRNLITPCVLGPYDEAARRHYGVRAPCLYLIRPDRYVAYRAQPSDAGPLLLYLQKIFWPAQEPDRQAL